MTLPDYSMLLTALSAGLGVGGFGGYLTRRLQKLEERIDNTNLKVLPAVYYNTFYFIESAKIFSINGSAIQFKDKVEEINKNIKCLISSGDVIPSDDQVKEIFKKILGFHKDLEGLIDFLIRNGSQEPSSNNRENDQERNKANNIEDLRKSFIEGGQKYSLKVDLSMISDNANNINNNIEIKLKGYKSISLKLVLLIIGIGIAIALLGLLTSSNK